MNTALSHAFPSRGADMLRRGSRGHPDIRQRYGVLEETLVEQEDGVRLFVLGRRGESAKAHSAIWDAMWSGWCGPCTNLFSPSRKGSLSRAQS